MLLVITYSASPASPNSSVPSLVVLADTHWFIHVVRQVGFNSSIRIGLVTRISVSMPMSYFFYGLRWSAPEELSLLLITLLDTRLVMAGVGGQIVLDAK